eukprot:TRINITY_DN6109_c0_g1_i4.p1 TRINITY_DN6109_c0_g1~~TRINITY_DN6109_c0_g1_i4.p1  ORF type:complete len:391 (-),score=82.92 TRINITY_DN6109_c0_g1_i4:4-1176(-)
MRSNVNLIPNFLKHLGSIPVVDFLLKTIQIDTGENEKDVHQWLCDTKLVETLIDKLSPSESSEVHENAAKALVNIASLERRNLDSLLFSKLESPFVLSNLFDYVLSPSEGSSTLLNGLSVVVKILDHRENSETSSPFLSLILDRLEKLKEILVSKHSHEIPSTIGKIEPFGFARLKIMELILSLIKTNNPKIHQKLIELDLLATSLELFFKYSWNNFLHQSVLGIFVTCLQNQNQELLHHVIENCGLIEKILLANKKNNKSYEEGIRVSYMGFLSNIAASVDDNSRRSEFLNKLIKSNAYCEEWEKYVINELDPARKDQSKTLGGPKPSRRFLTAYGIPEDVSQNQENSYFSGFDWRGDVPEDEMEVDDNLSKEKADLFAVFEQDHNSDV